LVSNKHNHAIAINLDHHSRFAAVTIARAATVYPILGFFNKFSDRISVIWRNIAMLGGVRGALSIALAATITTSAVISLGDIQQ